MGARQPVLIYSEIIPRKKTLLLIQKTASVEFGMHLFIPGAEITRARASLAHVDEVVLAGSRFGPMHAIIGHSEIVEARLHVSTKSARISAVLLHLIWIDAAETRSCPFAASLVSISTRVTLRSPKVVNR